MATYRVTKAIYHQGVRYEVGDVVENDGSLARIFGWEKVATVQPAASRSDGVAGMSKAGLLDLAHERGVEVPAKATKATLRELLEQ